MARGVVRFFEMSNAIDCHNQSHQSDLGLEKQWVTQDCYFRLTTTLLGMHAVDCWKLADYHGIINSKAMEENKMSIKTCAGILGHQLVTNVLSFSSVCLFSGDSDSSNYFCSFLGSGISFVGYLECGLSSGCCAR